MVVFFAVFTMLTLAQVWTWHTVLVAFAVLFETSWLAAVASFEMSELYVLTLLTVGLLIDCGQKHLTLLNGVELFQVMRLSWGHHFLLKREGVSHEDSLHYFLSLLLVLGVVLAAITSAMGAAVSIVFEAFAVQLQTTWVGAVAWKLLTNFVSKLGCLFVNLRLRVALNIRKDLLGQIVFNLIQFRLWGLLALAFEVKLFHF